MSKYAQLNIDKDEVKTQIFKNQDLCKLLYYDNDTPLTYPNISNTPEALKSKIKTANIFPVAEETGIRLIILFTDIRPAGGKVFKSSSIIFNILVHKDLWEMQGKIRALLIADKLDEMLTEDTKLSMGNLESTGGRYIDVNDSFKGYSISFKSVDFA
jgi:hypothetical protein